MGIKGKCVVCLGIVKSNVVREEFEDMLYQVDYCGVDSLTEKEQVVYEGMCCSQGCFDKLE